MTLATSEFIRRFLIHVLPKGQHLIRHYGFFGNGKRAQRGYCCHSKITYATVQGQNRSIVLSTAITKRSRFKPRCKV